MKYTHEFELFEIRTPNGLGNICYKAGSFCNAVLQSTGVRGRIEWILAGVANARLSVLLSFYASTCLCNEAKLSHDAWVQNKKDRSIAKCG